MHAPSRTPTRARTDLDRPARRPPYWKSLLALPENRARLPSTQQGLGAGKQPFSRKAYCCRRRNAARFGSTASRKRGENEVVKPVLLYHESRASRRAAAAGLPKRRFNAEATSIGI